MVTPSDSRSLRQEEGIQKWLGVGGKGCWEWATGMGKSHTAIQVVKRVQAHNPQAVTHIVVPTLYLQQQFLLAVQRAQLPNVHVYVINTYVREARTCDLLIADEVHLFLGEYALQFPKLFTDVCHHTWVLALSATLTEREQDTLKELNVPVCDTITLSEAQDNGWVSRCRTYNLGVELTFAEQQEYSRWNDIFNSSFARFGHDFALAMSCVADHNARKNYAFHMGWHPDMGAKDRWSPQTLGGAANQWLTASKKRQEVVNQAAAKYQAALFLCTNLPVKTICFSESTVFASNLAGMMPTVCRAYHSMLESTTEEYTTVKTYKTKPNVLTTKQRRVSGKALGSRAIADFNSPDSPVRVLSTAKALDQGADFQGLQLGIETSGNSSIRQKVQRTGRVVRTDVDMADKVAVYVHIFCLNTYEANKLRRKQRGLTGIIETTDIHTITL